jgi:hypothetical protein
LVTKLKGNRPRGRKRNWGKLVGKYVTQRGGTLGRQTDGEAYLSDVHINVEKQKEEEEEEEEEEEC